MSAAEEYVNASNLSREDWEHLIDQWIFSERDRSMLKRRLLDGITYEKIAEEFDMSTTHAKRIIQKAEEKLFKHIALK